MRDVAIRLDGVSKFYKLYESPGDRLKEALNPFGKVYHDDFYVLKNINLEIKKGEILGVVGNNGCGKSTLLKLISGVLTPSEGEITVNGEVSALLELGSGFNPEFTGIQNIYFYGTIIGLSRDDIEKKLDAILGFADIGDYINQKLKTYSSGMKARLGFSVAVHVEPDILILDEVLSVGDSFFKRKCYAKMEEYFDSGRTIIYVSHNLDSVNKLCTNAILINDGEVMLSSAASTVTKFYEKYIFAAECNKEKVRQEIKELSECLIEEIEHDGSVKINDEVSKIDLAHLPDLKSKTSIEYRNYDVDIYGIVIKKNTNKVNVLNTGERYQFEYKVKFNAAFTNVTFGMQMKTDKGQILSAYNTIDNILKSVSPGEIYIVKWSFICVMNAGMYYTNCGVTSHSEEGVEYLNRLVDATVFKVNSSYNQGGGLVSIVDEASIELLN